MDVNMSALGNGLDCLANLAAILDDGLICGNIAHGDFVPQWNIIAKFNAADWFAFQGNRAGLRALFQVGHRDADVIVGFVQ